MKEDRYFYSEEEEKQFLKRKVALVHKGRVLGRFNTLPTSWRSRYIHYSHYCVYSVYRYTLYLCIQIYVYTLYLCISIDLYLYSICISQIQIYIDIMYTSTYSMHTSMYISMYIHLCVDVLCIVYINIHCSHYFLHLNMLMSQSLFSSQHTKSSTSPLCIITIYFLQQLMAVGNVACIRLENELLPFYKHAKEIQFCTESKGKP